MGTARQAILRKSDKGTNAARCDVSKGLPLAFARASDEFIGMPLDVVSVTKSAVPQSGLAEMLPQAGLFSLLEAEEGATGGAVFDAAFVNGLTEHLTIGSVQERTRDEDRQLSAVDAALVAPVFDKLMQRVDMTCTSDGTSDWVAGHHFGSMVEDARTLVLSIFGDQFVVYTVDLVLGDVGKKARMTLILPRLVEPPRNRSENQKAVAAVFQENVLSSPANISAVLTRFDMPYDGLNRLELGSLIEIHPSALKDLKLEMPNGELLARAQLGQVNGQRAARVSLPEDLKETEDKLGRAFDKSQESKEKTLTFDGERSDSAPSKDHRFTQDDAQPSTAPAAPETEDLYDLDSLIDIPEN